MPVIKLFIYFKYVLNFLYELNNTWNYIYY